jgi:hypothetical protein
MGNCYSDKTINHDCMIKLSKMSLTTLHYDGSKDEVKPSVNTEELRVYGHPTCPYV